MYARYVIEYMVNDIDIEGVGITDHQKGLALYILGTENRGVRPLQIPNFKWILLSPSSHTVAL